ncbi:hypothetical protein SAMN05216251_102555 [Actinacidiphila alni]|uniref:Uncharacterized protein n=1 Tax=Actinacidiphila alni TaxID=380248 RepID=A0A1I1ZRV0_9ACTN|nr:hypothetical protein [Actinacidiphila alni]SFE34387.1 hypothetical protein SAMN05216251_102555 [Actinacidiphila alni]
MTEEDRCVPTARAVIPSQVRILTTFAHLSGPDRAVVVSARVAKHIGISGDTVTETLRFFASAGLLQGARGRYAITAAGAEVARLWPQDETRARVLLHRSFRDHWATRLALELLRDGPVDQSILAEQLQQGLPGNPRRGMYLVEWLVIALVVNRDGAMRIHAPTVDDHLGNIPAGAVSAARVTDTGQWRIMGMTNESLKRLPGPRYAAVLDAFCQVLDNLDQVENA